MAKRKAAVSNLTLPATKPKGLSRTKRTQCTKQISQPPTTAPATQPNTTDNPKALTGPFCTDHAKSDCRHELRCGHTIYTKKPQPCGPNCWTRANARTYTKDDFTATGALKFSNSIFVEDDAEDIQDTSTWRVPKSKSKDTETAAATDIPSNPTQSYTVSIDPFSTTDLDGAFEWDGVSVRPFLCPLCRMNEAAEQLEMWHVAFWGDTFVEAWKDPRVLESDMREIVKEDAEALWRDLLGSGRFRACRARPWDE